jgi:hypothetical protein
LQKAQLVENTDERKKNKNCKSYKHIEIDINILYS